MLGAANPFKRYHFGGDQFCARTGQPEGGANTKHSELDFAYGLAWHENMWADTLG